MQIEYYGTLLDQAGHGFYTLETDFHRNPTRLHQLPFNPEGLPYCNRSNNFIDGTVKTYHVFGFTICAIAGSPYDKRPDSKSIFFVEKEIDISQFVIDLKQHPVVQKILNKMPFKILW